jgi:hypothetical protein
VERESSALRRFQREIEVGDRLVSSPKKMRERTSKKKNEDLAWRWFFARVQTPCTRAKNCTGCKWPPIEFNAGFFARVQTPFAHVQRIAPGAKKWRPADRVQRYSDLDTVTHFRCKTHALVQRLGNTIYEWYLVRCL